MAGVERRQVQYKLDHRMEATSVKRRREREDDTSVDMAGIQLNSPTKLDYLHCSVRPLRRAGGMPPLAGKAQQVRQILTCRYSQHGLKHTYLLLRGRNSPIVTITTPIAS